MCGVAGIFGWPGDTAELRRRLELMNEAQRHRGPDDCGVWVDEEAKAGLGHTRLSIVDLTAAGHQPMGTADGRYSISFNGEVYNHVELREELRDYPFRSRTDTEVVLAAWSRWGEGCLERMVGMFAFVIWDRSEREVFAVRDRLGVKPLHYAVTAGAGVVVGSETEALFAAGVPREPDSTAWATYLARGWSDYSERTFWKGVWSVPAGCLMRWREGRRTIRRWYELSEKTREAENGLSDAEAGLQYRALLENSVRLRFRADVPVGINLSGGLDSSVLLGLVHAARGESVDVQAFTFTTGDGRYDELPWVREMLGRTRHELVECRLSGEEVPGLHEEVMRHEGGPYGGVPTLAYAKLFEEAGRRGVKVLMDGQGMDEQWAGYDYYEGEGEVGQASVVQGSRDRAIRPDCLTEEFLRCAEEVSAPRIFGDRLRDLQYRDACLTKLPRALRYNDRVSMRASVELREPFLDHRLVEFAFWQPGHRKIRNGTRKYLLRELARELLPDGVVSAPKRPVQTPQREWLRGELREWAQEGIRRALKTGWFHEGAVWREWEGFLGGKSDNSAYVWQWVCAGSAA